MRLSLVLFKSKHVASTHSSQVFKNLVHLQFYKLLLNHLRPLDQLSHSQIETEDLDCTVRMQGPVLVNVSPNLVSLRLGGNSLTGEVLSSTFNKAGHNFTYIELDNNQLTGLIPPESGSCKKLALLNLVENQLTGALPP